MTSPDNALWEQCWRDRETDFHQREVNPLLQTFWPGLSMGSADRILVPLCGKSLDMLWLASRGHTVIGVELSPIAVASFFDEHQLKPVKRQAGPFTLWEQGPLHVFCGDFFQLTADHLGPIDAVYDRAALTALPEEARRRYVAHLDHLLPASCKIFLLTTEDAEPGESAQEVLGTAEEVTALYGARFHVELAHVQFEDQVAPGAAEPGRHKVYRLLPRRPLPPT